MLYKIYCDKFKKPEVEFKDGLNVILGTSTGDNSIGKTSMLLIIDFVYGGDSYVSSSDIINNVGEHDIYFAFMMHDRIIWYCRNNIKSSVVWVCDENKNKIEQIAIGDYRKLLAEYYEVDITHASFRDLVSGYMRIYGKENHDEHRPLDSYKKASASKGIFSLIKIFDEYDSIDLLEKEFKQANEKKKAHGKALKFKLIENVNKTKYNANKKEVIEIGRKIAQISKNYITVDEAQGIANQELLDLKNLYVTQLRLKNRLSNKLERINCNIESTTVTPSSDLVKLREYFGEFNESKFMEVETFHFAITQILHNNLIKESDELKNQYEIIMSDIAETKNKLEADNIDAKIFQAITKEVVDLNIDISMLKQQNKAYEDKIELESDAKNKKRIFEKETVEKLGIITNKINSQMNEYNNDIYKGARTSPILSISNSNQYKFFTPNDTGTGIAYKGLILFDLAVLNLTNLPIVIHDSILLKQTEDFSIEKIIGLYNQQKKQIFIAFDKGNSYTSEVEEMIASNTCLKLSSAGGELFGKSWGKTNIQ